jgi:DNA-binding CsgD family transcriptional regulator
LKTKSRRPERTLTTLAKEVFEFAKAIRDCKTLDKCAGLFRAAIVKHGFDSFACGELDLAERNRSVFYIVNWPKRMFDFYVKSGYIDRDPLIDELKRVSGSFTWSELLRDKFLRKTGSEMLGRLAEEGWTEGLVVPFRRSETRFGLVSIIGSRGPLHRGVKDALSIMALCLHEQARRLGPSLGVALALSAMSLRELDSLRLVARGHSDKEIALLGIAESTAHEHVESAKRKLSANAPRRQRSASGSAWLKFAAGARMPLSQLPTGRDLWRMRRRFGLFGNSVNIQNVGAALAVRTALAYVTSGTSHATYALGAVRALQAAGAF